MPDGPARRVGPHGVLIGRHRDCDIVLAEPTASRHHALVRANADGVEVLPLGRTPLQVNNKQHDRACMLRDGDTLQLPGLVLTAQIALVRLDAHARATYRIERARGGDFGIVHTPFVIGGGKEDDLVVKRWPHNALRLHVAQHELFVEATVEKATRNGVELEVDVPHALAVGDTVEYRKESFTVRQAIAHDATTAVSALGDLPTRIQIEMLPRGGRVLFTVGDGVRSVYLADRGLDFVIALIRPPAPYAAGDFIPDDVIRPIVWPRNPGVGRPEINVLISRCRRALVASGLAGPRLIQRADGGGGTRLALAAGAEVLLGDG